MLYVLIAVMIGLVAVAGFLRLLVLRSRAARHDVSSAVQHSRRPAVDHYAPTVGTSSERKRKGKKSKRDSPAFHPVPPEEREANRRSAGLGGATRIKRRRDRDRDNQSTAWSSSTGSDPSPSYDSSSSSESSTYSPSYDSPSYDSSSDYSSSSSDSGGNSSSDSYSDSSSGGDFGGGGSTDSY